MADPEDQIWMSLRVAIAWVFTLDLNFLIEFERLGPFWDALNKLDVSRADAVQPNPNVETIEDVWVALRNKIVAGKIELRGMAFKNEEQRTESKGSPRSQKVAVRPSQGSRRIEPHVASKLTICEAPEEFQLKPENGLQPENLWWGDVVLSRRHVLEQFEPSVFTPTILSVTERRQAKLVKMLVSSLGDLARKNVPVGYKLDESALAKITRARADILRAYVKLRLKNKRPYLDDVARNRDIQNYLNPRSSGEQSTRPSKETIGRSFSDYEEATGVDLMRIDEFCSE